MDSGKQKLRGGHLFMIPQNESDYFSKADDMPSSIMFPLGQN